MSGQDPIRLLRRMEDVQAVLQCRGRWVVATVFGPLATAAAIPLAASETANSNRENGASSFSQVSALRSAVLRQKTAVMLAGSMPIKVGRPQKRSCRWREFGRGGHRPRPTCQDRFGALRLGLDPAPDGRMVGDLGRGQEDAQEFLDLSQAQAHGEGGDGHLPLLGLVASDQVFGIAPQVGDLLPQPSILVHERGGVAVLRLLRESLLHFAGVYVDRLAAAPGLLGRRVTVPCGPEKTAAALSPGTNR